LASLKVQKLGAFRLELAVIDNCSDGSARDAVRSFADGAPFPVAYHNVPIQGISRARNIAIDHAISRGADFLAFIDDDETAADDWIYLLFEYISKGGFDAVAGSVEYRLPQNFFGWPREFFEDKAPKKFNRAKTPKQLATNNVIISARLLRGLNLRFDLNFDLTGSGDSEFFYAGHLLNCKYSKEPAAIVVEAVLAERVSPSWVKRRIARISAGGVRIKVKHHGFWAILFTRAPKIPILLFVGLTMLPFGLFSQKIYFKSIKRIWSAIGIASGLSGKKIYEYKSE